MRTKEDGARESLHNPKPLLTHVQRELNTHYKYRRDITSKAIFETYAWACLAWYAYLLLVAN